MTKRIAIWTGVAAAFAAGYLLGAQEPRAAAQQQQSTWEREIVIETPRDPLSRRLD